MNKFYPIKIIQNEKRIVFYPQELNLQPIQTIAFGNLSVIGSAEPHQSKKKTIEISSSLAEELHIPYLPLKLHLFEKEGTLFIGPILGIFTAGFTNYPHTPLGNRSSYFAKLLSLHDQVGVFPIVFGLQHINWKQGLVTGYFYSENNWQQVKVPIPNVIYDRLPNRTVENLKMIQEVKMKLSEEYVIPWFNPGFFNKWDIYVKLRKNNQIKPLLPKTFLLTGAAVIESALEDFHYLYLKPIHGSLGNGIYQIKKYKEHYYVRFRDENDETCLYKFTKLTNLINFLKIDEKKNKYIVQEGIPLITSDNRMIDFRVHTNKDENGEWIVTAIASKASAQGSPTTHLLLGGTVQTLQEVFPEDEIRKINTKKLSQAAVAVSKELNKYWDAKLAEIGFDIGIDQNGKVWLFEANAKPGRLIFTHPKLSKNERYTHKLILKYAVNLTKLVIDKPEKIFHELVLQ